MSEFKGDYLGFTYNNEHSSSLGIVRVSNGGRFSENLLPTIQDKTVQVPGGDGTYYFGSYYTQRQISVPIAFDEMTEEQFKKMRQLFGDKQIHDLVFDEAPYKAYQAKVTGTAQIKHLVFDEDVVVENPDQSSEEEYIISRRRIYKGEGTLQFTCYQPYAICKHKYLDDEYYNNYKNLDEWAGAANLQSNVNEYYDTLKYSGLFDYIDVYNAGDIDAPFSLLLYFNNSEIINNKINLGTTGKFLKWSTIKQQGQDAGVQINSRNHLIEGIDGNGNLTGNVYNKHITDGDFFLLPVGETRLKFEDNRATAFAATVKYWHYYL